MLTPTKPQELKAGREQKKKEIRKEFIVIVFDK